MKCPYSSWDLQLALLSIINDKKFDEKTMLKKAKEIEREMESAGFPKEKKDLNKKIAEYHGIGVEILVNSSNYKVLCQEYQDCMLCQVIKKLKEKLKITDEQAWAITMVGLGLLE